jgi:hypothetical protein
VPTPLHALGHELFSHACPSNPERHVQVPTNLSHIPLLLHSAKLCALSTPILGSAQAYEYGHVFSEQSGPVKPSKQLHWRDGKIHRPLPLQSLGHGDANAILSLWFINNTIMNKFVYLFWLVSNNNWFYFFNLLIYLNNINIFWK